MNGARIFVTLLYETILMEVFHVLYHCIGDGCGRIHGVQQALQRAKLPLLHARGCRRGAVCNDFSHFIVMLSLRCDSVVFVALESSVEVNICLQGLKMKRTNVLP